MYEYVYTRCLGRELVILTRDPGYRNNGRLCNLPPLADLLTDVRVC